MFGLFAIKFYLRHNVIKTYANCTYLIYRKDGTKDTHLISWNLVLVDCNGNTVMVAAGIGKERNNIEI